MRVHANYVQTSVRFSHTTLDYEEYAIGGTARLSELLDVGTSEQLYDLIVSLLKVSREEPLKEGMQGFEGYLFADLMFERMDDLSKFTVMELRYVDPKRGGVDLAPVLQSAFVNNAIRHKLVHTLLTMIEARNVEAIRGAIRGMEKAR